MTAAVVIKAQRVQVSTVEYPIYENGIPAVLSRSAENEFVIKTPEGVSRVVSVEELTNPGIILPSEKWIRDFNSLARKWK